MGVSGAIISARITLAKQFTFSTPHIHDARAKLQAHLPRHRRRYEHHEERAGNYERDVLSSTALLLFMATMAPLYLYPIPTSSSHLSATHWRPPPSAQSEAHVKTL